MKSYALALFIAVLFLAGGSNPSVARDHIGVSLDYRCCGFGYGGYNSPYYAPYYYGAPAYYGYPPPVVYAQPQTVYAYPAPTVYQQPVYQQPVGVAQAPQPQPQPYQPQPAPSEAQTPQAAPATPVEPAADAPKNVTASKSSADFTDQQGRTCRHFETVLKGDAVAGTACLQADGSWRTVGE